MTDNQTYLSTLTVLYAEDEPETQAELKKFLSRRVGKVITASDGREALEKITQICPDIVIADLIMPHMDGLEMIRSIREKHPMCKIIITSTVSEMQTVLDAVDIGIIKYIIKPIVLAELDAALLKCAEELRQVTPVSMPVHPEERKFLESQIKKELSALIKKQAGKGPRDIAVFIHEKQIDIVVYDAFTAFEHTLLQRRENYSLVEQCRRSFYYILQSKILDLLTALTGDAFKLSSVEINPQNYSDKICLVETRASGYSLK